jgi:hypothetical protein
LHVLEGGQVAYLRRVLQPQITAVTDMDRS